MEYQKIITLLDNESIQPSKFRKKNWVEKKNESRGTFNVNSQIKFTTSLLKANLYNCSNVYILVKGNIPVNNTAADGAAANNTNKKVNLRIALHLLTA